MISRIDNLAIIHLSTCNDACIAENVSSYISDRVGASLHVHVSTKCFILHAAYFILHVHVLLASQQVFIYLMSTTHLDNNAMHSPNFRFSPSSALLMALMRSIYNDAWLQRGQTVARIGMWDGLRALT